MHLWMTECHVPFSGHCDLDLVLRIIMSGAYLLFFLERNPIFDVWVHLGMVECRVI